ncbi:MAG: neutral/alkaline non-lysosomal ceramidase N-terminal domain-containing protein [bacterium]
MKSCGTVRCKGWLMAAVGIGLGVSSGLGATPDANRLYAGTAKVDITPAAAEAIDESGRALSLHDPIYARVLVLKNKETSVAIVSVDLEVFPSAKVVAEAKAKWKVEHVLLCATHTHSVMAPKGLLMPPAKPDWTRTADRLAGVDWPGLSSDPWYAATEDKIVAAIGKAMGTLFPANVVAGKGRLESAYMAHNRRLVDKDGKARAMWDNPKRLPTEPVDSTVGVLKVEDDAGKTRVLLVHYACHPVGMMDSGVLTRDYPGAMVDYVEQELGSDCMGMFIQGASGDIDPYDMNLSGAHRFNMVKQAGISLGKCALRVVRAIDTKQNPQGASLQVKESVLTIPCRTADKTFDVGLMTMVVNHAFALVGVPGEPFTQLQLDLTRESPVAMTFMTGVAFCGTGFPFLVYVPTAQALKEGGYGASECSFLETEAGNRMVKEAAASLREMTPAKH